MDAGEGWKRRARADLFVDEEPVGAPEDITPARTFFVRMVAQREIEVNELEWFQTLKRHGVREDSSTSLGEATTQLQIMKTLPHGTSLDREDAVEKSFNHRDDGVFKRRVPILQVLSPFSIYYCCWQYFMMVC